MRLVNKFPFYTLLTGLVLAVGCEQPEDEPATDCLVRTAANNGQIIEGQYIVTYKEEPTGSTTDANGRVMSAAARLLARHDMGDARVATAFDGEQAGFVAELTDWQASELRQDPVVEMVEPDRVISMCTCLDVVSTSTVTWNIQRTGFGRAGLVNQSKSVWVLDTGIDLTHPDLNVDAQRSRSFVQGINSADDQNGHGTHVAGIIAARNNEVGTLGIASGARLVALKILNDTGEGRLSGLISAVAYVNRNGQAGDVVNMSLGGEGISNALEREIRAAAEKGILFAIAAGNEGEDVEKYSPARVNHPNVFTVSAMDINERFAEFSNFGSSVDVCAYGVRIRSTFSDGRYATLSGTSMAAPHVAGLLFVRGRNLPTRGFVQNDPDGQPDPIARE